MHGPHYIVQMLCPSLVESQVTALMFLCVWPAEGTKLFDLLNWFHLLKTGCTFAFFPEDGDLVSRSISIICQWDSELLFTYLSQVRPWDILSITLWNPRASLNLAPFSASNRAASSHTRPRRHESNSPAVFHLTSQDPCPVKWGPNQPQPLNPAFFSHRLISHEVEYKGKMP